MTLERYLPRSLKARFTLLVVACTAVVFLCTAPFIVGLGRQLLLERKIRDIQSHLDAVVSKGDGELRAIRQQALGMTDVAEQWDDATVAWINLKKKGAVRKITVAEQWNPSEVDAWFDYMEYVLSRLPKAYGVRFAFEQGSVIGPRGVRSIYVHRAGGVFTDREIVPYLPGDPKSPGAMWYLPVRGHPDEAIDGIWSDPYTAPETDHEMVVTCAAPIVAAGGGFTKFDGVAAIDVKVGTIAETLSKMDIIPDALICILNPAKSVTIVARGGGASPGRSDPVLAQIRASPNQLKKFSRLQDAKLTSGSFVDLNPYTGERSCFFYQLLPHNSSQLVYVIPVQAINRDVFWLAGGVIGLGIASIFGMGVIVRWSAGLVTSNLEVLRQGVQNVREGNLRLKLPPATRHDETADVIEAFNGMVGEIERAFVCVEDLARSQQRIATELDLARKIQQSALPGPIQLPGGRVCSTTLPAQQIGGDFYDHFFLPGGRVALAVGDVSGKGVSAALFAVRASMLLRSAMATIPPQDALAQVNSMLVRSNPEVMFVTLFVALWDPGKQSLSYVNAGHNPPFLVRSGGDIERLSIRSGPALGAMSGQNYHSHEVEFCEGDLLAIFTDGITEAPDKSGQQFGEVRLQKFLPENRDRRLRAIEKEVIDAVGCWQGGEARFDDITLLLARAGQPVLHRELAADLETIEQVVEDVRACAMAGGMSAAGAGEIALAACEVVTNIITHALKGDRSRWYRIFAGWTRDELVLRFEDDGPAFDPEALPAVNTKAALDERPIGGLGWVLIRQSVDIVRMDRVADTNILILVRHRNHPGIGKPKDYEIE